jgi:hypothetical protein
MAMLGLSTAVYSPTSGYGYRFTPTSHQLQTGRQWWQEANVPRHLSARLGSVRAAGEAPVTGDIRGGIAPVAHTKSSYTGRVG